MTNFPTIKSKITESFECNMRINNLSVKNVLSNKLSTKKMLKGIHEIIKENNVYRHLNV